MVNFQVCLFLLLSGLALTSVVNSIPLGDTSDVVTDVTIANPTLSTKNYDGDELPMQFYTDIDNSVDESDGDEVDPETINRGIPDEYLDEAELALLDEHKFILELGTQKVTGQEVRKKRSLLGFSARFLITAARLLFRGARIGRLTRVGSRLTRHYVKDGTYKDALKDFGRFKPNNLKTFNGKISGRTGTVGKYRLTVRDGSSEGNPTLEVQSALKKGGTYIRKFRYAGKGGKGGIFGIKLPF